MNGCGAVSVGSGGVLLWRLGVHGPTTDSVFPSPALLCRCRPVWSCCCTGCRAQPRPSKSWQHLGGGTEPVLSPLELLLPPPPGASPGHRRRLWQGSTWCRPLRLGSFPLCHPSHLPSAAQSVSASPPESPPTEERTGGTGLKRKREERDPAGHDVSAAERVWGCRGIPASPGVQKSCKET